MTRPRSIGKAIVFGGVTAAACDILGAYAIYQPAAKLRLLQSIASGLIGNSAFQGGAKTAALGLALHLVVGLGAASVYVLASRVFRPLVDRPWVTGPIYGLGVWLFMNYVVIPHSAIGRYPGAFTQATWLVILLHFVGVGLPIALFARRYAR